MPLTRIHTCPHAHGKCSQMRLHGREQAEAATPAQASTPHRRLAQVQTLLWQSVSNADAASQPHGCPVWAGTACVIQLLKTETPHRFDGRQRKRVRPRLLRPQRVLTLPGGFLLRRSIHTGSVSVHEAPASLQRHVEKLQGPHTLLGTAPLDSLSKSEARNRPPRQVRQPALSPWPPPLL